MIKLDLDMWKEFSETSAIGGREEKLHNVLEKWIAPYVDRVEYDHLMSTIGVHDGTTKGPRILFTSHLDEVGFQVKHIDEDGYIYMQNVGGWWAHVLPAHLFRIETRDKKEIIGVVGICPPHGLSTKQKETVLPLEGFYLDLGVQDKQEVLDLGIRIGDQITPYSQFREMNNTDFLLGKAWDDRCCVGILWETARLMKDVNATVYFAGTAQEEVGQRGARTVAHKINPDIHIALDVTDAQDTPFEKGDIILGGGPVLTVMDASSIAHKELFEYVEKLCEDEGISFQYACTKDGGTDNGNVHKSLKGIMGMTISVPTRYMHSSYAVIHQEDMKQTIRLLQLLCEKIENKDIQIMKDYNR